VLTYPKKSTKPIPMKKILVPVDFSGHTEITCKYAMELAKAYSAEIHIFHTFSLIR